MILHKEKAPGLLLFTVFVLSFNIARSQSIMETLKSNRETTHFAQALEEAHLNTKLGKSGPFTLFAPSNEAFDKLSASQKHNNQLLLNHIFTGLATERSLKAMADITCLSGKTIKLKNDNGNPISVDSFKIIYANIRADNGVIHVIDGVIK
ncbi:MAG: fasciclin domain-containing protein [Balneolaceae bacterium]|jgi:uncharacterized surface protein with fasciclin (FAS1) repeats